MSEEQIVEQEPTSLSTCTKLFILVLATLVISTLSLVLTAINTAKISKISAGEGGAPAQQEQQEDKNAVVISKQYDKGQSFEKALATKKPMVVFFYTDWCGFCQRFAPTFHKVTKTKDIKKNFAIAYVNCDSPENRKHMEEFGVQGFPTVYVIDKNNKRTQLENGTFFTSTAEKDLPVTIMNLLK